MNGGICAGPHAENTNELNQGNRVGKCRWGLLAGDETKAQLQRIYATAWESPEQLSEYKRRKERHCGEITEGWAKNWGCSF